MAFREMTRNEEKAASEWAEVQSEMRDKLCVIRDLENDIEEKDRRIAELEKTVCAQPGAVQCAKKWEADHQRRALKGWGLAEEFPFGCDAIGHVSEALVASRKRVAELEEALRPVSELGRQFTTDDAGDVLGIKAYVVRLAAKVMEGRMHKPLTKEGIASLEAMAKTVELDEDAVEEFRRSP